MNCNLIGKFVKVLIDVNKGCYAHQFYEGEIAIIRNTHETPGIISFYWNCQIKSIEGKRESLGNLLNIERFGPHKNVIHFKLLEEKEQRTCEILYGVNNDA